MEKVYKFKHKALLITGMGTFLATLDSSIVNVSLPTLSRDLGTSISMVGWVILSYSIVIFSFLMVFGTLSEKKGLQFNYRWGFVIFFIGSALCGLSFNIYMLIISRIIQGFGAAFLVSVGPALITRSFPESERGKGLSRIAMVVSTGLMLGPPLGGFIIALAGWRWIFFVNLPVCLLGIYLARRFINDFPVAAPQKKISFPSTLVLSLCLFSMMFSILLYSRNLLSLQYSATLLAFSIMMLTLFIYFESKPNTRLIGLDIFKNRMFVFSGAAMLFVFIPLLSVSVLMPFFLEEIKHLKPEQVGLYLMTVPLCAFFVAPVAGYLADKIEARIISTVGIGLICGGIILVHGLHQTATLFNIILPLMMIGIGMALFNTPNTSSIMGSVKKSQLGIASGMVATIRTLGISYGVGFSIAIFSFYRNAYEADTVNETLAFMFGYHSVYEIMLIPIILAIIFSLLRGRNNRPNGRVYSQES